jgi:hypothetical protein
MLRFHLRTLLIVVALLAVPCAWVSYSLRWIRDRRELLNRPCAMALEIPGEVVVAPGGLWLFGEWGYAEISIDWNAPMDADEARRLFPEALVRKGPISLTEEQVKAALGS